MQAGIAVFGLLLLAVIVLMQRRRRPKTLRDVLLDEGLHSHLQSCASQMVLMGTGKLHMPMGMLTRLRSTVRSLSIRDRENLLPAAQWLTDNARMLEEAYLSIQQEWKHSIKLPRLSTGEIRVQRFAQELISHTNAHINANKLMTAVAAWQQTSPFTQAELWSLPLAINITLLQMVDGLAALSAGMQKDSDAAPLWAARLTGKHREGAKRQFKNAPQSTTFLERLLSLLRETEDAQALAWLDEKLAEMDLRVSSIVEKEHTRQTNDRQWMGNAITSLRRLTQIPWGETLEAMNPVHNILAQDPSGVYPDMDFESRDMYRRRVQLISWECRLPESLVARTAIACAKDGEEGALDSHIGYYLIDGGQDELVRRLGISRSFVREHLFFRRHCCGLYLSSLWVGAALGIFVSWLLRLPLPLVPLLLLVWSELVRQVLRKSLRRLHNPRTLPRLEILSLPEKWRTLIVCPTLLTSAAQAMSMVRHLMILRHANPDDNLHFMLLGDFADSLTAEQVSDQEILSAAKASIDALNQEFGGGFSYLQRARVFSQQEKMYMGRERKRGALEALNRMLLGLPGEDTFLYTSQPTEEFVNKYTYVITLDSDTILPPGSALRLVGAMAHPLQKRQIFHGKLRGKSILQPRMEVAADTVKTRISAIFGGRGGIDPYNAAVSDLYQDMCNAGSFAGKGIYDPTAFVEAVEGRIAPYTILSHDLLEGELSGGALLEDIALFDGHPGTLRSWMKRLHRWTRGDWQLLPWLFRSVRASNRSIKNPLSRFSKHKIWDNMRRSLVPAAQGGLLLYAAATARPYLFLLILILPNLEALLHLKSLYAYFIKLCGLPYEIQVLLDAVARTVYRVAVSRKHMLQWVTAAQAEQGAAPPYTTLMWGQWVMGGAMALLSTAAGYQIPGLVVAALWLAFPFAAPLLDAPLFKDVQLEEDKRGQLTDIARATWRYFEKTVTSSDHYLPPDNLQIHPDKGIAHRTSPTNMGLYLLSCAAAQAFGFLEPEEMARYMEKTISTMEKLKLWEGHFYNWYDTRTLEPLKPFYVSSVDSGNLAACLLCCAQVLRTLAASLDVSQRNLSGRMDSLALNMNLRKVYDPKAELFYVGINAHEEEPGDSRYDLLASESRLLSFVAVMTRQVPARHWFRLSRTLVKAKGKPTLVSWSGTMFEYLMPNLLLPLTRNTLLDSACRRAVKNQMQYTKDGVWGVSESGYYAFDPSLNYQYQAFGLPSLALGNIPEEGVLAPYASGLALTLYPEEARQNLMRMKSLGFDSHLGFFEAVDFNASRIGEGKTFEIVRSHMSHHQGMMLCSLCNLLCKNALVKYFDALPSARAYGLLLQEKMPQNVLHPRKALSQPKTVSSVPSSARRQAAIHTFPVDAHLMHGSGTTMCVTAQGGGFLSHDGVMISRFKGLAGDEDGIQFYLRDVQEKQLWQPTAPDLPGDTVFETGQAVFTRTHLGIESRLSCFVNPLDGAALHLLEVVNRSNKERTLEAASYFELALSGQKADATHPAFRNLFIQTERAGKNVLCARRRPRDGSDPRQVLVHGMGADVTLIHTVAQSDRSAFLGRGGSILSPREMTESMSNVNGRVGAMINPCMSLRTQFMLPAHGRAQLTFCTILAEDEQQPYAMAGRYETPDDLKRARELAITQGLVTAKYLAIDVAGQNLYGRLAGCLMYGGQPGAAPTEPIPVSMQALWGLGISGDLPIITVEIYKREHLPLARTILSAHAWWRIHGVWADLALINCHGADYDQPVRDALRDLSASSHARELIGKPGGVHLIDQQALTPDAEKLLRGISRLYLSGEMGSLGAHFRALQSTTKHPGAVWKKEPHAYPIPLLPEIKRWMYNGYGGFTQPEGDYVIDLPKDVQTPAPWCNLLSSPIFGTLTGETGPLFTYANNSHHGRITRWPNDPVSPRPGEGLILRDEETGVLFSPCRWPLGDFMAFRVIHSPGATVIQGYGMGLETTLQIFTDAEHPVSLRTLRVKNTGDVKRVIMVCHFADFTLGESDRSSDLTYAYTDGSHTVMAENPGFLGTAFLAHTDASDKATCAVMATGSFWGLGSREPTALKRDYLPQAEHGSLALVTSVLHLSPGQSTAVTFALGAAPSLKETEKLIKLLEKEGASKRLKETQRYWAAELTPLQVLLPDLSLGMMMNRWLPYQVRAARLYARAGFYQAGGAIGFRDQLQDMLALLYTKPQAVRTHLLQCAAHQFEEGDVQHWWHPPALGVRTRITDDLLFLPFVTASYIEKTGDHGVLFEHVPYLIGPQVPEGQEDWYGVPWESDYQEPLVEHCLRAIRHVRLGEHGIPLMGGGDWNDGMNRVGEQHGESVWLGFFLCEVLRRFAPLTQKEVSEELYALRTSILQNIEEHAWDGDWYLRAWYDNGKPLGSRESLGCKIDNLSQSWSVLSGANPFRSARAVDHVWNLLYDSEHLLLKLLDPAFDGGENPGYISGYVPGVRENGGQYSHAVPWTIWALLEMKDKKRAYELLQALLPLNHARTRQDADRYKEEPYVMVADIYTNPDQMGRGGWTWYTGSAAWLYVITLEKLLGFEKRGDKVRLNPRVPDEWQDFTITYQYGRATYHLTGSREANEPMLDGSSLASGWITFKDDGRIHEARFPIKGVQTEVTPS